MRAAALAIALLAAAAPAAAQETQPETPEAARERVVAALSQNRIAITAGFEGSEIFVYGAIARDGPAAPEEGDVGVVIRVAGPSEPVIVRRKDRVAGVWANVDSARIDAAPSFYAVASTGPLHDTISHTEDLRRGVSLERALRFVDAGEAAPRREEFLDAVVRLRRANGRYVLNPGGVTVTGGVLFQTSINLPANIVEGVYDAHVLLTRDRAVVDDFRTTILVRKEGLERLIYDMSRRSPFLYGLASIAVALAAGFGASEAFRYLRR